VTEIDVEVVRAAQAGDGRAFARIVDHYHSRCLRFAQQMLLSSEDAEEAVQDALVRVYDALPRFDLALRFEPWLFRILANRCRTARVRRRRHEGLVSYMETAPEVAVSSEGAGVADEELWAVLGSLSVEQREAFLLHHVEGMGYDDMSVATGVGVSALKMRVKRATDTLRARLLEVYRG
jgi:RNA polymerase sigma-70 factor (ECF subfamily)